MNTSNTLYWESREMRTQTQSKRKVTNKTKHDGDNQSFELQKRKSLTVSLSTFPIEEKLCSIPNTATLFC